MVNDNFEELGLNIPWHSSTPYNVKLSTSQKLRIHDFYNYHLSASATLYNYFERVLIHFNSEEQKLIDELILSANPDNMLMAYYIIEKKILKYE